MDNKNSSGNAISRREFLGAAGLGAMAVGLGATVGASAATSASRRATTAARDGTGPYNILFILVDQERFFRPGELPAGYRLPGHERLMK